MIEWTRLEAEKVTADQIGNRKRTEPPSLTKGGIRMKSPADASTAYGMTGTQYNADAEGIFIVSAGDVRPLLAAGWVELRAAVAGGD